MELKNTKKFPSVTPEIYKLLRMGEDSEPVPKSHLDGHEPTADLPKGNSVVFDLPADHETESKIPVSVDAEIENDIKAAKNLRFFSLVKILLPFLLVFVIGFALYYFFFANLDFGKIFKKPVADVAQKVETQKENALSLLQKENLKVYQAWVEKFYFDVSDPEILDPNTDNSGNGLSNFQKFLLKLNPKSYDTLGLGRADSESLALGINPLTGNKLTDAQKKIIDEYFDMEVISNRLTLVNLHKNQALQNLEKNSQVAGSGIRGTQINSNSNSSTENYSSFSNQPVNNPVYAPVNTGADLVSGSSLGINEAEINTNIPGRLEIPVLGINVPIIWTVSPKNFEKDLQRGVVHYPGTALPGQTGTAYISGHSSNYVWAKGSYNTVFSKLGDLPDNTSFKVTVVQKNGKDARFFYVVTHRKEYKPTDQEQFKNQGKALVALSTCWPVGSTAKRLVVFAELTQTEND